MRARHLYWQTRIEIESIGGRISGCTEPKGGGDSNPVSGLRIHQETLRPPGNLLLTINLPSRIKGLEGLSPEELDAVLAIRNGHLTRRQAAGPGIRTQDGNVVIHGGDGGDVVFRVNGTSISASELPIALRGYTDATVDALGKEHLHLGDTYACTAILPRHDTVHVHCCALLRPAAREK